MRLWLAICMAVAVLLVETSVANGETEVLEGAPRPTAENDLVFTSRKKSGSKKGVGLREVYMAYMAIKTMFSTIGTVVSSVVQIKSFGLSVINTIINIIRFIMELKQFKESHSHHVIKAVPVSHYPEPHWSTGHDKY